MRKKDLPKLQANNKFVGFRLDEETWMKLEELKNEKINVPEFLRRIVRKEVRSLKPN